jgi:hypothetical protein
MADDPMKAGLLKAGRFMMSQIKRKAPSAKSADSFYLDTEGENVVIVSHDTGTVATNRNWRHPLWGDREGPWYDENQRHPERTHFVENAADEAATYAAERAAEEWVTVFTRTSAIWEEAD